MAEPTVRRPWTQVALVAAAVVAVVAPITVTSIVAVNAGSGTSDGRSTAPASVTVTSEPPATGTLTGDLDADGLDDVVRMTGRFLSVHVSATNSTLMLRLRRPVALAEVADVRGERDVVMLGDGTSYGVDPSGQLRRLPARRDR